MFKLYRASAGSGKTYTLTKEYLFLLFEDENNFRKTLAVTFTNKASGEMKERIVSQLHILAKGEESGYLQELMQKFSLTAEQVRHKAFRILNAILHNYSYFAIETIDSFFQRITQQFTRELGIGANFTVELDNATVLEKVIEILLLELDGNDEIQQWITKFSEDKIENRERYDVRKDIANIGKELFKEDFFSRAKELQHIITDKENAKQFFDEVLAIKKSFEKTLTDCTEQAYALTDKHGLQPGDFKGGARGLFGTFNKYKAGRYEEPANTFKKSFNDVEQWYTKTSKNKDAIETVYSAGLNDIVGKVLYTFENNFKAYNSALAVYRYRYTLALLADLSDRLLRYCEDENIFLLSNNNVLINEIVKENEASFIYEKTGSYIENYMIDEFQDTSRLQWSNFKPLLENSIAEGGNCLLVGDVKQSIYRWRNGDWKLLGEQVPKEFPGINIAALDTNWRSSGRIVEFNNTFFYNAAEIVQREFDAQIEHLPELKEMYENRIKNAYSDVLQLVPANKADKGHVKVTTIPNSKEQKYEEQVLEQLPELIESLQEKGCEPGDIVFLVRRRSEAVKLVDFFAEYKESGNAKQGIAYDIVSTEALRLTKSRAVNFIINLLELKKDYNNDIAKSYIQYFYTRTILKEEDQENWFDISKFDRLWSDFGKSLQYANSLYSFVEQAIEYFRLNTLENEIAYVMALQNVIYRFEVKYSASYVTFLEYWEENKEKLFMQLAAGKSAMNVMTIHKSKGLEFKTVIMPFASWRTSSSIEEILWCTPAESPFDKVPVLPVKYTKQLENSIFYKEYFNEKFLREVDMLNMYYVAFTRAADCLYLYLPAKCTSADTGSLIHSVIENSVKKELENVTLLELSAYITGEKILEYGEFDPGKKVIEEDTNLKITAYPISRPCAEIMPLSRNMDYFDDFDTAGNRASYGVLMHGILEQIECKDELEKVLKDNRHRGVINEEEQKELHVMLTDMLTKTPFDEWFSLEYEVYNERDIIMPTGQNKRPDRMMIKGNDAIILDYKFTMEKLASHREQVTEYKDIMSKMGYNTKAFLYYGIYGELLEV